MKFWADLLFYLVLALLASPVYIVVLAGIRHMQRRFGSDQPHAGRWAHLGALLTTPLLCWLGFRLALALYVYYPHRDFDAQRWAAEPMKRYELVEDLQESQRLIGLTQEQVASLLGTPDLNHKSDATLEYYLGIAPGIGFTDGKVLTIEFKQGKAVRYWTRET